MTEPSLESRAIALLARREHSRQELMRKLGTEENRDQLCALLDDLEARGWLSNTRFAEQWVKSRQSRYGSLRLRQEMQQKGLPPDTIQEALNSASDNEMVRAREIWRKKFGTPATTPQERAKHYRFLQGRGFSLDIIRKVLSEHSSLDDDDLI